MLASFWASVLLGHCLLCWHLLGRLLPSALKFVNSPSAQTAQILVAPPVTRFLPKSCRLAVTALRCDELRGGSCAGIFLGRLLPSALKFVNSPSAQTAQISVAPPVTRFFPKKLQACSHCPSL